MWTRTRALPSARNVALAVFGFATYMAAQSVVESTQYIFSDTQAYFVTEATTLVDQSCNPSDPEVTFKQYREMTGDKVVLDCTRSGTTYETNYVRTWTHMPCSVNNTCAG